MSPSNDVPQTPELKPTASGIANVFKTLTGGRIRSPAPPAVISTVVPSHNVQAAERLRDGSTLSREVYGGPADYERLYEQLKAGKTLSERLAAAEALRYAVADYPMNGVINIWYAGKDLITSEHPPEARVVGFDLLTACVQHESSSDLQRKEYFDTITMDLIDPSDFHLQLAALVELTKHGKNLSGFHYDFIPLLTKWLGSSYTATKLARKAMKAQKSSEKRVTVTGEETNLQQLFNFMIEVIKFSFNVSDETKTAALIDMLLYICGDTTVTSDLRAAIDIINTIITYGDIPLARLPSCIETISAIHCLVPDFQEDAWRTVSMLAKSHYGQSTVRILLDCLLNPSSDLAPSGKQSVREIRGSLSVLKILISKDGRNGYPLVPFTTLVEGLETVTRIGHTKVTLDCLDLIVSLFDDQGETMYENVLEESWTKMLHVASECAKLAEGSGESRSNGKSHRSLTPLSSSSLREENNTANVASQLVVSLADRITNLVKAITPAESFLQRDDCIKFLLEQHKYISDTAAALVIEHFVSTRACYPSDPDWQQHYQNILRSFFTRSNRSTEVRQLALRAVTDVFDIVEMMDNLNSPDHVRMLVLCILEGLPQEHDITIVRNLVDFSVSVADNAETSVFELLIDMLHESLMPSRNGMATAFAPLSNGGRNEPTPSFVITRGIIQIFMRSMDRDVIKTFRAYDELLWIAKTDLCEPDARIAAFKLLFRLRADWAHRVFLTAFTESDRLAASLYRTPESLARKQEEDELQQQLKTLRAEDSISRSIKSGQGSIRSSVSRIGSGVTRTLHISHPIWLVPDLDALPEQLSERASSIISSVPDAASEETTDSETTAYLRIDKYLEVVISLLREPPDWEIYSYILVHLPSQLTNHALFRATLPQIHELVALICEQVRLGSFKEPPTSSGLRKADIAICLFHILTVVASYRSESEFSRNEDDEIVRAFIHGISGERTAKCCIHALSICCHEIPSSISRSLATILQKMTQIITQSQVAVHVLEFLGSLARLPELFVNFREDDYRLVFGICWRFLQYVREQANKNSSRVASNDFGIDVALPRTTSDDLPQYVHSLAYHVIIFWFLSLRLPDRASHVGWITKTLVSTDSNGREMIEEQAQVTIDFMQRVAFADQDESKPDPNFTPENYGEILKRTWVCGSSIITIEQAARGGWAQLTKRQPSGTSCYTIRENYERPPPHQVGNSNDNWKQLSSNVLPSHLLLQLYPTTFHSAAVEHPIPLPDDGIVKRAIDTFDRIPALDGHKVGVIYIAENQTSETEILANVMGSSDYIEFLSKLGSLTKLKGATFNTQGLDRRNDTDGEYAFCWRDRVTEIVFHATTQMPTNLEEDPQCINKKRHIGNDFVNIIFNNSGLPFDFNTFPSQFNYVYIIITPESRASFVATRTRSDEENYNYSKTAFYKVEVISQPGFPEISPAADMKIVSLKALPDFVRLLALNASVFTQVWQNRDNMEGEGSVSSWRNRLREIKRLRDKYRFASGTGPGTSSMAAGGPNTAISPPNTSHSHGSAHANAIPNGNPNGDSNGVGPGTSTLTMRNSLVSLRRGSVVTFGTSGDQRSSIISTDTEVIGGGGGDLVEVVDFSRWA